MATDVGLSLACRRRSQPAWSCLVTSGSTSARLTSARAVHSATSGKRCQGFTWRTRHEAGGRQIQQVSRNPPFVERRAAKSAGLRTKSAQSIHAGGHGRATTCRRRPASEPPGTAGGAGPGPCRAPRRFARGYVDVPRRRERHTPVRRRLATLTPRRLAADSRAPSWSTEGPRGWRTRGRRAARPSTARCWLARAPFGTGVLHDAPGRGALTRRRAEATAPRRGARAAATSSAPSDLACLRPTQRTTREGDRVSPSPYPAR